MSEWISVKDRLPEYGTEVLVACGSYLAVWTLYNRLTGVDYWEDSYGYNQDFADVTHWMSLPEPPKED